MKKTITAVLLLIAVATAQVNAPNPQPKPVHKFIDRKAVIFLSASAAVFATDAAITCNYLGTGPYRNHEAWLPVKTCTGIGAWMAGSFASQVGASYLLHRTGHHRWERVAEILWSSASAYGIAYSLNHKPRNPPGAGSTVTIVTMPHR